MGLTNAGRNFLAQACIGDSSPILFTNANARIGVGSSATLFGATQTDLLGTSTRKGMDVGYPQRTNNVLTFKSTFGATEGNHDWNEWGIFNASSGGTMLNRAVEALGTKSSGTWVLTITLTLNAS